MRVDLFDFDLPEANIALRPAQPRDTARLLTVRPGAELADLSVRDLPTLLEPGDVLVLYTDGATEASSPSGEEWGRERLAQAVKENYDKPAREIIASLQLAVLEWTDNVGSNDDVTFFIIKALK